MPTCYIVYTVYTIFKMENLVGLFRLGVIFILVLVFITVLTDSSFLRVFSSHIHQIPFHFFITDSQPDPGSGNQ